MIARIKQINEQTAKVVLSVLKPYRLNKSGVKAKTIKPMAEPYPCTFCVIVTRLLVSPTENNPDRTQPPIA